MTPPSLAELSSHAEALPSAPQTRTRTLTRSREASGANGQGISTD